MSNSKFIITSILLILLLPFIYGGCYAAFGGGNTIHDGDDDPGFTGVFISNSSQARITPENALQLAAGALAGGLEPVDTGSPALEQAARQSTGDAFRVSRFPLMLADALRKIEVSPALIFFNRSDIIIEDGRFKGNCGGSFAYTLQLSRGSETFSGRLAFEKYCTDGFTISGNTDVDGSFQTTGGDFVSAIFRFENLSDGARSMEGEISMDFSAVPLLANFNAYSTDEDSGQVYWIKDYSLNLFEFSAHVEVEIFGTFHHPDYGFVELSTSEPFILHAGDNWPASGQLVIYGEYSTGAQLLALDHLRYAIEADLAGDGIFDRDSRILSWNSGGA